jgi:medium-chain acyl-[acyl-carrier-protein] hydrolase
MGINYDWWMVHRPRCLAKLRLFCFPFAGGDASAYYKWADRVPETVELLSLQLPGRGSLYKTPLIDNMDRLMERLLPQTVPLLDRPYIFFGHSLGARIAFELSCRLRQRGEPLPQHFVASGSLPPQLSRLPPMAYELPTPQFKEELRILGGTPDEVLDNPQMLDVFLPMLRSDFQLFETYRPKDRIPLPVDLSIWGGIHDPRVSLEHLLVWGELFTGRVEEHFYPGGHIFIEPAQCGDACLADLGRLLEKNLARFAG